MHLDTVFTFCNTDVRVTAYAPVIDNARAISLRPGRQGAGRIERGGREQGPVEVVGMPRVSFTVVETAGDVYGVQRGSSGTTPTTWSLSSPAW